MSERFRAVDRDTAYLLPPSVQDWLPEQHLARFVVDVVSKLDLDALEMPYAGRGTKAYHPEMLLALLFYGCATGVFASRKLEEATYDSLAFRYIVANTHPDHDTIATFRKRFLKQLKPLFVQILLLARTMGFLNLGKISLDGSKVQANASKHNALSWGHATELEQQLKAEVARFVEMAAAADEEVPEGMNIPEELKRREDRLKAIAEAKAKLESRAAERHAAEKAEYEAKMAKREARAKETGKRPRGKPPKPPEAGGRPNDQINLTDEESRIMPASGHSFQQAYNVQAGVDTETVTPHANDKQEIEPALKALGRTGRTARTSRRAPGRQRLLQRSQRPGLRGCGRYALHCNGTGAPSPAGRTALDPTSAFGSGRRSGPGDGASLIDAGRPGHLRRTEVDGRAGLRNHQIGAGISTGSPQRTGRCFRRMDAGQHGLESEAALQSLPAALIADRRSGFQIPSPVEKTPLRMPAQARQCRITAFLDTSSPNRPAKVQSSIRRRSIGAFKSDSLLAS